MEPKRRIVHARRLSSKPIPTIWIVILSHASIQITTENTIKTHVSDGDNQVILEKIPPSFHLEYESTCSCPSVVTCDEKQSETLLSYAEAWKTKDIRHEGVLHSRRRAKSITESFLKDRTLFPLTTESIFREEMGINVIDSGCKMLPTKYLLDKNFSSEVPLIDGNLFGGSIYMFYQSQDSIDLPESQKPKTIRQLKPPRFTRKRFPVRGLFGKQPRHKLPLRMVQQTIKKKKMERALYKLFKAPFIYPLLINSSLYYHDCIDDMNMESLHKVIPFITTCEKKLIDEFPQSTVAIQSFFRENKEKEEYIETQYLMEENGEKMFDLKQISDLSNTLKKLEKNPEHLQNLPDEEIDELNKFDTNRVFKTNVNKIISLLRALFPNGANIKWMDYSCNNFSTDDVGCDEENRMMRRLLQYKKSNSDINFGG